MLSIQAEHVKDVLGIPAETLVLCPQMNPVLKSRIHLVSFGARLYMCRFANPYAVLNTFATAI